MDTHTLLLIVQYDGGRFSGWQRQAETRTVQGEIESTLTRITGEAVPVAGAGRTDTGVHAIGQGASIKLPKRWTASAIRRALNALLPDDIWIAESHEMVPNFHARFSATARRYGYLVGTDEAAKSPFRRRYEWSVPYPINGEALVEESAVLLGEHTFRAFAVIRTAPIGDDHRCIIREARWTRHEGRWEFEIEANRFLHHMVRFLVGTLIDVGQGRRPRGTIARLLTAPDNLDTSSLAPSRGLTLRRVFYPSDLYLPQS
ncbi:MAG: tRNA pseudouridine(38-40) synthase TruA [Gemmatimonadaceae bacterium]